MTIKYRESFYRASKSIPTNIYHDLEKRGFYNLEIIFKWKEIVGIELASKFIPHSVKYKPIPRPRYSLENEKTFLLVLFVTILDESMYYKFDYIKTDIINRINLYFGRKVYDEADCIRER